MQIQVLVFFQIPDLTCVTMHESKSMSMSGTYDLKRSSLLQGLPVACHQSCGIGGSIDRHGSNNEAGDRGSAWRWSSNAWLLASTPSQ